jgi:hypothetical protein
MSRGDQDRSGVTTPRASTDAAQAGFRGSALSESARRTMSGSTKRRTMSGSTKRRLDELLTRLDGLAGVRARIDARTVDALGAVNDYDAAIDSLLRLFGSVVLINDPVIYQQGTAIVDVSATNEFMLRENALVTAALTTPGRSLAGPEYTLFTRSADNGRYLFDRGLADMKPSLRGPLDRLAASSEFNTLRSLEDAVAGGPQASLAPGPAQRPGPARVPGYARQAPALRPPPDADRIDDSGAPELPRRVRQASLAPRLRRDTPARGPVGTGPATTRPPEETGSLMASLQQGWQRGREEEDPDE